jgi:thiol:disulfide interchange protein DsbD
VGVLALIAGAALFIGALAGSRDPLQPLAILRAQAAAPPAAETGSSACARWRSSTRS